MAEIRGKGGVRPHEVRVHTGGQESRRIGVNLDDVVREILLSLKHQNRWESTAAMARRLGLKQQTVATFIDESRSGTTIATLSTICAALQESPVAFFQRHERYRGDEDSHPRRHDDLIFSRFRALLDRGEAARLVHIIEAARDSGALPEILTAAERILPLHRNSAKTKAPTNRNRERR